MDMNFLGQERYYLNETYIDPVFLMAKYFFCSEKLHLLQNCAVSKDLQPDHLVERFYFERFLEGGQEELRPDWSERRWNQANLEITFLDETTNNLPSLLII